MYYNNNQPKSLMRPTPPGFSPRIRKIIAFAGIIGITNWLTFTLFAPQGSRSQEEEIIYNSPDGNLYLLDKASLYISDTERFEDKVREISFMLGIAPEWLMAVMYTESRFDPSIFNRKGSGAVGLIQFMPQTAQELNVSTYRLQDMDPIMQLEYVYVYLIRVRERYGPYKSLTDLYLGVLYPKARNKSDAFVLFSKPSQAYKQNSGLDQNRDGRVTVGDIDVLMFRRYPGAYSASIPVDFAFRR